MKRLLIILTALALSAPSYCQTKMAILGDSYSTYEGYVEPDSNAIWYADESRYNNDVHHVESTWWWILAEQLHAEITRNNSYSGSTICNTGYYKKDYSDRSFIARMDDIGKPDILFVFGGTNDCWANVPLGNYVYANWTKDDLFKFRPALCFLLQHLKKSLPSTRIIFIVNSKLSRPYTLSMYEAFIHYQTECIQLDGIDKQDGHPSTLGMQQIAMAIINYLKAKDSAGFYDMLHFNILEQSLHQLNDNSK